VRWTSTVNYDLLFFTDELRVIRGYSWRDRALYDGAAVGETKQERIISFNEERLSSAQRMTPEEIYDYDAGNRIINTADIRGAELRRRLGISVLRLRLSEGTTLKYKWMNSAMAMTLDDIRGLIERALPGRLVA
jgi:hypothetical protein